LDQLSIEQKNKFTEVLSRALDDDEIPVGLTFFTTIVAAGSNQSLSNAAQSSESYHMTGLYYVGAAVAGAIGICTAWKILKAAYTDPSSSKSIRNHLDKVITN
jgi:Ni,Fe-hydrogenase I small subunit